MDVFWITPKWPFPVADGARIATTQLLQNLSLQGMKIHLCSIVPEGDEPNVDEAYRELGVSSVSVIRRPKSSRFTQLMSLFQRPTFPITLAAYAEASVKSAIANDIKARDPELVVYDGLHSAAWRLDQQNDTEVTFREVYRAHNVESAIWFRGARETSNVLKKALLYYQGGLVKRTEIKLVAEADYTFPVSAADETIFRTYVKHGKIATVPIGIRLRADSADRDEPLAASSLGRKVLFVGKLDWPPNREGLQWVLDKVWPKLSQLHADLELTIVGSGERGWLNRYQSLRGVRVIGQVENLAPYYSDCLATLVPVFYGSGTRVKAIESSLYGRMCISTEIGVEGMGLVPGATYSRAETAEEWIQAIGKLDQKIALEMGQKAKLHAENIFDPSMIAKKFKQNITPLEARSLSH